MIDTIRFLEIASIAVGGFVGALTVTVITRELFRGVFMRIDDRQVQRAHAIISQSDLTPSQIAIELRRKLRPKIIEQAMIRVSGAGIDERLREIFKELGLQNKYVATLTQARKWTERLNAAKQLGDLGIASAIDPLMQVVRDRYEDNAVREAAADALAKIHDEGAVPLIVAQLESSDEWTPPHVASALVRFGSTAVKPLVDFLCEPHSENARAWAARILGKIGDREALVGLLKNATDPSENVRAAVVSALAYLPDPSSLGPLVDRTLHDPSAIVRGEAASSLRSHGRPETVRVLTAALSDPSHETRIRALDALEAIRSDDSSPLEFALRSHLPEVRFRAALALERVGFLQNQIALLFSGDEVARTRARENIFELGRAGLAHSICGRLADGNAAQKIELAKMLPELPMIARSKEFLLQSLDCDDRELQLAAIAATAELQLQEGVPKLASLLPSLDQAIAEAAAQALKSMMIHEGWSELAPVFEATLQSPSPLVREVSVLLQSRIGTATLATLSRALTDSDANVRAQAARLIASHPEQDAVPLLHACLVDPDATVQIAAVDALEQMQFPGSSIEKLFATLAGAAPDLRERIAAALASLGLPALLQNIRRVFNTHRDIETRLGIAWMLGKTGDSMGVSILVPMLHDDDPRLRASVVGALAKLSTAQSLEHLLPMTNDVDPHVRAATANALGRLKDTSALPPLFRLLTDKDRYVRNRAILAMGQIGGVDAKEAILDKRIEHKVDEVVRIVALGLLGDTGSLQVVAEALLDPSKGKSVQGFLEGESNTVRNAFYRSLRMDVGDSRPKVIEVIEHFQTKLRASHNRSSREIAVQVLASLDDRRALNTLIDALRNDPLTTVRAQAARALLGHLQHRNARDALIGAILDPRPDVAVIALRSMANEREPKAVENALCRLGSGDARFDHAVVETLAAMFEHDPDSFNRHVKSLEHTPQIATAIRVLGRLRTRACVSELIKFCESTHAELRSAAIESFALFDVPESHDILSRGVLDQDVSVRVASVRAMGARFPDAWAALIRDPAEQVRAEVAKTLGKFGDQLSTELRSRLVGVFAVDPSPSVRAVLTCSLIELGDAQFGTLLRQMMAQNSTELRTEFLARCTRDPKFLQTCQHTMDRSTSDVRSALATLLGQFDKLPPPPESRRSWEAFFAATPAP